MDRSELVHRQTRDFYNLDADCRCLVISRTTYQKHETAWCTTYSVHRPSWLFTPGNVFAFAALSSPPSLLGAHAMILKQAKRLEWLQCSGAFLFLRDFSYERGGQARTERALNHSAAMTAVSSKPWRAPPPPSTRNDGHPNQPIPSLWNQTYQRSDWIAVQFVDFHGTIGLIPDPIRGREPAKRHRCHVDRLGSFNGETARPRVKVPALRARDQKKQCPRGEVRGQVSLTETK